MNRLSSKVAIVTGGASGLGEACVRLFLREGARVVIADMQDDLGGKLSEELGPNCAFVHTDVSRSDHISSLVDETERRFGNLAILVNNAGINIMGKTIADYDEAAFDKMIGVDLKGVWLGIKYAIPAMLSAGGGAIVNIASVGALIGYPRQSAYGAAKAGVAQLTRNCAAEYSRKNIRANCICPGGMLTPLSRARRPHMSDEEVDALVGQNNPLGRACRPEDVANAVLWLASDEAAFVNGQVIAVDGGASSTYFRRPESDLFGGNPWESLEDPSHG